MARFQGLQENAGISELIHNGAVSGFTYDKFFSESENYRERLR